MAYDPNMVGNGDRSINSQGISIYGPEAVGKLGYFNTFVSIELYPIKPPELRTAKSIYDYTDRISCVISREDTLYLAWMFENVFIRKCLALEPCFTGLSTGVNTMVCFSNGITEENKVLDPYIVIYKGLDEKKRAGSQRILKFRPRVIITMYDSDTGESDAIEDNMYGILVLSKFFAQAANALAGGYAHMNRYFERFRSNDDYHVLRSIAGKLGIPTHNGNQQSGAEFNRSNNYGVWKNSNNTENTTKPISTVEDLSSNTISSSSSEIGELAALMSSNSVNELPGLE